jgi:RNA polymerase sigma factor (sigma-70 family)
MMGEGLQQLVHHLRRWADPVGAGESSDRQLLECFAGQRDEAAFAELVRRHGPMVLGVARRVLGDVHDAEDVFQAAFLVLARKAGSVRWRESVGAWLFPVAYHLALKVRAARERRRVHEAQVATMPEHAAAPPDAELRAVLDEELARLPDHYRTVVVLCYLEGRTQREAARQLGLSPGEVRGRLDRARGRLRQRLARRGLALSGAAVVAALVAATASAAVPPALAENTARAAALFAVGGAVGLAAVVTPRALHLTRGALQTMLATKAIKLTLIALILGVLGAGTLLLPPLPALGDDPGRPAARGPDGPADRSAPNDQPAPKPASTRPHRSCIILWMSGGPSQIDTFDPKAGGPFKAIDTTVKGVQISEHLPEMAKVADRLAIIRSMTHDQNGHVPATYLMHTGHERAGETEYPSVGSLLARELRDPKAQLPGYVSLSPTFTYPPGPLGAEFAPLVVPGLPPPAGAKGKDNFDRTGALPSLEAFEKIDKQRAEAMREAVRPAFDLSQEKEVVREAYGHSAFGEECLVARRLVERGVPVVEVTLGGWDAHGNVAEVVKRQSDRLDPAWATLLKDLNDHGLLDSTLVVWMGEFGRTPQVNTAAGRDHWPHGFSVVLAGAGIRGGQVIGKTGAGGTQVEERPVTPPELLATIFQALNVDPGKEYRANGLAIPHVEKGTRPVKEVLK